MKILEIEPTYTSPKVVFDHSRNFFQICGSSIVKDVARFYSPLFIWMDQYLESVNPSSFQLTLDFTYLNASSSKVLLQLIYRLKEIEKNGGDVMINWMYCKQDPNLYEVGQNISALLQIPFNFIDQSNGSGHRNGSSVTMS